MLGGGNPVGGGSPASTGNNLNYIGQHVYANSGIISVDGNPGKVLLSFTSGTGLLQLKYKLIIHPVVMTILNIL